MGSVTSETELGKKLQLARKRAGLTQQELCQKAGLSYSTLAKIERGAIRSPSVFTVAHIASATGTPIEDLLDMEAKDANSPALGSTKKRSKSGIRFVYFDVNGTLVQYHQRAFTQIAQEAHRPVEIIESLFLSYDAAACRGSISDQEINKIFAAELGLTDFNWQKYYMQNVQATPQSIELIEWAAEHYEIGLLTNNRLGYTKELIRRGIIPGIKFAAIVESAEVGCSKPESKIYEIARGLAAMEPEEILLVDDIPAYLKGAEQAGWQVQWFDEDNPEDSIKKVREHLEF